MAKARQGSKTARKVALEVLDSFDEKKHDSKQLLHDKLGEANRKAKATDIVYGVIRNRPTLDMLIIQFSGLELEKIQAKLINILRIGVYEMVYVPETASYAVVNEGVNLAHSVGGQKGANFVNAILRKISRMIVHKNANVKRAVPTRFIPADFLRGCEFMDEVLPDPQAEPATYLAKAFSLPEWLTKQWLEQFGFDRTKDICFASNRRPGTYLQPNTLHMSAKEFADRLTSEGVSIDLVEKGSMIKLKSNKAITTLPGYVEGFFSVQDPTAADVANVLAPKPSWSVLDLCSAPGGKTVRLAQVMKGRGNIYATDIDADRLKMVDENCLRLGIVSVKTFAHKDLETVAKENGPFDAAIVDVPCSNTGVLARRPEVRLRLTSRALSTLPKTQLKLLETAAGMVKSGGKICYSTCSINDAENTDVVKAFLKNRRKFTLEREKLTVPFLAQDGSYDYDGGYVAIIAKQ